MSATVRYHAPRRFDRAFNAVMRWLVDRGVNLAGAQTLAVVGRVSGKLQRIPVNPLSLDGADYLVSVRGESQWVRNARAAGTAELRRGRRSRRVTLEELGVAERAAIIAPYLTKWGWEVGRLLPEGLAADADAARIEPYAAQIPVFRVR